MVLSKICSQHQTISSLVQNVNENPSNGHRNPKINQKREKEQNLMIKKYYNNKNTQQDSEKVINNIKPQICINSPPIEQISYNSTKPKLTNQRPKSQLKLEGSGQVNTIHKKGELQIKVYDLLDEKGNSRIIFLRNKDNQTFLNAYKDLSKLDLPEDLAKLSK